MFDITQEDPPMGLRGSAADWGEVLSLTEQMQQSARNEAWEELVQLSQHRHHLVLQGFETWKHQLPAVTLQQAIAELRRLDEAILGDAESARSQLAMRLERLETGKRARRAYHAR